MKIINDCHLTADIMVKYFEHLKHDISFLYLIYLFIISIPLFQAPLCPRVVIPGNI